MKTHKICYIGVTKIKEIDINLIETQKIHVFPINYEIHYFNNNICMLVIKRQKIFINLRKIYYLSVPKS